MTRKCLSAQPRFILYLLSTAVALVLLAAATVQGNAQQYFTNPDDATAALAAAAKADDTNGVMAILGPNGQDIVSSGDSIADKNARVRFLAAYDAKHQITREGDNKAILVVGTDDWPFPIPVVRSDNGWHFDTIAGRQEILFRRIGGNERNAIQVCLAYVDAQNEYAEMDPQNTGVATYAEHIISHPGKKDGLYWPAKQGEAASPLGEFVADATREGYRPGERAPYNGYYYKILQAQGAAAQGGAFDYVVHGKMIGGFALIAYPAAYRNSGVMTFVVNHEGAVFQKDLGPHTAQVAEKMTSFNPDSTWKKVTIEPSAQ